MRKLVVQSTVWLAALIAALGWYYLAPTSLGGSTTYVVTDGVSMLPHFHGGDLALVKAQPSYRVGEVVAYRSRLLHTIVLHRIVARDGSRYVFKGDNNDFLDTEQPTRSQLVGRLWLHLPGLGTPLARLHSPVTNAICAALATLLLLGGAFEQRRRRQRRRGELRDPQPPSHDWRRPVLKAGLVSVVPFSLLALLAFTHPEIGPRSVSVDYRQSGAYSYSAQTATSTAYPSGKATTGDPLFLTLVDAVRFGFAYRFHSAAPHAVAGTASFAARLHSSTGWTRTVSLQRPTPFAGDRVTLNGTLRLSTLSALLQRLRTTTGTPASYEMTLVPRIRVHGTANGLPVKAAFGAPLTFSFDLYELQPLLSPPPQPASTSSPPTNVLAPASSGSADGTRLAPLTLGLGPFHPGVTGVRRFSVLGLGAALLCLLLGYPIGIARLRRPQRAGDRIRTRYARFIVPIARADEAPQRHVVHVSDMDALVRVAERYERMILHERQGGRDAFSVSDDGVLYRYVVDEQGHVVAAPAPAPAPAAPARELAPVQLRRA